jgi:hypothetical protein
MDRSSYHPAQRIRGSVSHQEKPVAFITTLKNGVNGDICTAWASLGMGERQPIADTYAMPLIVDDQDRSLAYAFFEGPYHPEYVVLDHCMQIRHRLGPLNDTVLFKAAVDDLVDDLVRSPPRCTRTRSPKLRYVNGHQLHRSVSDTNSKW